MLRPAMPRFEITVQRIGSIGPYADSSWANDGGDLNTIFGRGFLSRRRHFLQAQKLGSKSKEMTVAEEYQHQQEALDETDLLKMFSNPKQVLNTVLQRATGKNTSKEDFSTFLKNKVYICTLNLDWPKEMHFVAHDKSKAMAEKKAAAMACLKLKELNMLSVLNLPKTSADYNKLKIQEAVKREKRPCQIEIPPELQQRIRFYLAKNPVAQNEPWMLDEKEQELSQAMSIGKEVMDMMINQPYVPLDQESAEQISSRLHSLWKKAKNKQSCALLPVDSYKEKILEALSESQVVVIAGETGCGKTTRIPRMLLESWIERGLGAECNVLVTQPRRICAVSVRLESSLPEFSGGAMLFLTVGVMLRKIQSNPDLLGISHVVVDEVHERDVNTDLLLSVLRKLVQRRPDLRVVLMSASGDTVNLSQYFGGCPIVKVPGFLHPVQQRFLEEILQDMGKTEKFKSSISQQVKKDEEVSFNPELVADVIHHVHHTGQAGAILCFVPGLQDIGEVKKLLESKSDSGDYNVIPLHSSLSVNEQKLVFPRPPYGKRKIILSTNIAETSITINDIVHVVDSGCHKEQQYDPRSKINSLVTTWVSQANVIQRRGRAGRCQPGFSHHIFSRSQFHQLSKFPIVEIQRIPLESVVMQIKLHSPYIKAGDFLSEVMDAPDPEAVEAAVSTLKEIGVLDSSETLTQLGVLVSSLTCDPRLGKALVYSTVFGCVFPLLSIIACLCRDPFKCSLVDRSLVKEAKNDLSGSTCSDHLIFSRILNTIEELGRRESIFFMKKHMISQSRLYFISGQTLP
ncbi:hypothetical protein DNTS_027364 [Danionella cerebrum]|uniref:RNA helicase n=1 Tax=Danionella cerebrum TaxID=2873325 RepID=A0A553MU94_9TELE|nr:hypothetical protein DNTS_027364 [Danionella translucida]